MTRRDAVRKLVLQGQTIDAIASMLGISATTVKGDIKSITEIWRERASLDWDKHVAEQLARIEHLERITHDAWERSLEPEKTVRKTHYAIDSEDGKEIREVHDLQETTKTRNGDASLLAILLRCIAERSKLLGLYARDDEDGSVDDVPIIGVVVTDRDQLGLIQEAEEFLTIQGTVTESREK